MISHTKLKNKSNTLLQKNQNRSTIVIPTLPLCWHNCNISSAFYLQNILKNYIKGLIDKIPNMGSLLSYTYYEGTRPSYIPESNETPTFPPDLGFEEPRKERVMKVTEQEMQAMRVPPKFRDYCAHLYIDLQVCRRDKHPLFFLCKKELHDYHHCQEEDYKLRMMNYEREKRLRMRQLKAEGKPLE